MDRTPKILIKSFSILFAQFLFLSGSGFFASADIDLNNAIVENDLHRVRKAVLAGAQINITGRTYGHAPLTTAACAENIDVVLY
jgi:hypothetical protein